MSKTSFILGSIGTGERAVSLAFHHGLFDTLALSVFTGVLILVLMLFGGITFFQLSRWAGNRLDKWLFRTKTSK